MNSADPEDILFETLSLTREIIVGEGAPYGGFGGIHIIYPNFSWENSFIEVWKNNEGKKHRLYGPAYINKKYKLEEWYKNGILHRIGGPARTHRYNMFWYKEGKLHNLEGPAVIEDAGPKQYWIDGIKFSRKQYEWEIARRKRKGII